MRQCIKVLAYLRGSIVNNKDAYIQNMPFGHLKEICNI